MEKALVEYIDNRKARYNYFIEETYNAGISLIGPEVKSIRARCVDISEAYCVFNNNELILKNCFIYNYNNAIYTRKENIDRTLLLTKKELRKLKKQIELPGYSIIPISIIIPKRGYIKVKIGLCKGKKNYDKRETIKKRDIERENKHLKL